MENLHSGFAPHRRIPHVILPLLSKGFNHKPSSVGEAGTQSLPLRGPQSAKNGYPKAGRQECLHNPYRIRVPRAGREKTATKPLPNKGMAAFPLPYRGPQKQGDIKMAA